MKFRNRLLSIFVILILLLLCIRPGSLCINSYASSAGIISEGVTSVNFRKSPGGDIKKDSNGNNITLSGGQKIKILNTKDPSWYRISVKLNGKTYKGYVSSQFITVTNGSTGNDAGGNTGGNANGNASDFETSLANEGFPESYKTLLRDLHKTHPSWQFKAVNTGLDWNTVVSNEINKAGQIKNLVYCTSASPHYNWRSTNVGYNATTNTWSPYDGSAWFAASDDLVRYYLDPRSYMYENYIFVFESLSYQSGVQTADGVEAILSGSFMCNATAPGEDKKYSNIIMSAAKDSGVSPYHIASRIKLEMGSTAGTAASGKNSTYPGIYNFFNIGAFDTPNGSPAVKGLAWAAASGSYGRPWNSVSKSIIGGSNYLGDSYIKRGQDTLYTQKFNVTYTGNLYNHQYMSNIQSPATESLSNYKAYQANNLLDTAMVFKIPVYNNMPANATVKPADSGNPNNYLKQLGVKGYSLTPTVAVNDIKDYSLIVDNSVGSVTVTATPISAGASVAGTGTFKIKKGTNIIYIKCTSETGTSRTYNITIVRGKATGSANIIDNGVGADNSANSSASSGKKGDVNGDGKISVIDIVKIQRYIVGLEKTAKQSSLDINGDGKVSVIDIVKLQRHIVGIETIK